MSRQYQNGRVIIQPDTNELFKMYDKIPANQCVTYREPTLGQWEDTMLSKAFFSKENIQIIQNGLRAGVFNKSNGQYTIGPQDCDSLKIIMRSIFLSYAANLPSDITGQISALNKMVLDYCIERVYGEAEGYMKYLFDLTTLAVPLAPPVMSSENDRRTHKMKPWF